MPRGESDGSPNRWCAGKSGRQEVDWRPDEHRAELSLLPDPPRRGRDRPAPGFPDDADGAVLGAPRPRRHLDRACARAAPAPYRTRPDPARVRSRPGLRGVVIARPPGVVAAN